LANIKSAKKRIRVIEAKTAKNRRIKFRLKGILKAFESAVAGGDKKAATENLAKAEKKLQQAAAKGTIHKNAASRKTSRITQRFNAAFGTYEPTKLEKISAPAKKKKAPAKKTVAEAAETAAKKETKAAKPAAEKKAPAKAAKPAAEKKPATKKEEKLAEAEAPVEDAKVEEPAETAAETAEEPAPTEETEA